MAPLGLPVYHEWMGKFGELIRVDGGRVIDKRRMSSGRALLQPIVFIDAPEKAVAYFRQARSAGPPRIASALTDNAGQSWVSGPDLDLANPNAAIAGLQLSNGDRLIALNDLESARHRLVLAIAPAGTSNWNVIAEVESDQTHDQWPLPRIFLSLFIAWRQWRGASHLYLRSQKDEAHSV
jgi:hypothetical protein